MLTLRLYGDKQGAKFAWSITAMDSRGAHVTTGGADDSERDAKASIHAALGALVEKLEFRPIDDRID